MSIQRNVAGQKIAVYAWDTAANAPKTGDAANITAQISKDYGTSAATDDTNPTELDATNHPGVYVFDLAQAETDAATFLLSAVSSTSDVVLDPVQVYTDLLQRYLDGSAFLPVDAHKPNFTVSGDTLTVYEPDGSTPAYTKTVTTDPAAEPITGAS